MKNIWRLFLEDLKSFKGNVIAAIVAIGLILIPPLYAWFNLLAFWDPYAHTGNIKVAVANDDEGFESKLSPAPIEAGADVVASLRANDSFDWVFTSSEDAVEGVKSGEYYAALVIPKSFSSDLMTVFSSAAKSIESSADKDAENNTVDNTNTSSGETVNNANKTDAERATDTGTTGSKPADDTASSDNGSKSDTGTSDNENESDSTTDNVMRRAEILYYTNQKENAVAPRLTQKGADAIEEKVDQTFSETVGEVVFSTVSNLVSFTNSEGIFSYAEALNRQLGSIIDELEAASSSVQAFSALTASTSGLLNASASVLNDLVDTSADVSPMLSEAGSGIDEACQALDGAIDLTNQAFDQASASFDTLSTQINNTLNSYEALPTDVENGLNQASSNVGQLITAYQSIESSVQSIDPSSPALPLIQSAITELQNLQTTINNTIALVQSDAQQAQYDRTEISNRIESARSAINALHIDANSSIQTQSDQLKSELEGISSTLTELNAEIGTTASDLAGTASSLSNNLTDVESALQTTATTLNDTATQLSNTRSKLDTALNASDVSEVRRILGDDPQQIAKYLSAPTKLNRIAVFAMANNGSAMSSFYTSLTLWIGAIFMVALMQTDVSAKRRSQLKNPTLTQLYLGRFVMFWLIGFLQATIVCLGNVLFLGVQCEHFMLYLLTGWVAALVFDLLVYTLTVSFGKVGEALAIVGLVLQIAGSGGIFPVSLSAPLFQVIYPWLPFSHSMTAFESCIAGIYGNQYWVSLGMLALLLIPSLILGIVLRRPVVKLNDKMVEKLEETKLL